MSYHPYGANFEHKRSDKIQIPRFYPYGWLDDPFTDVKTVLKLHNRNLKVHLTSVNYDGEFNTKQGIQINFILIFLKELD